MLLDCFPNWNNWKNVKRSNDFKSLCSGQGDLELLECLTFLWALSLQAMDVWAVLGYSFTKKQLYPTIILKMYGFEFGHGRDLELFNPTIIKICGSKLAKVKEVTVQTQH